MSSVYHCKTTNLIPFMVAIDNRVYFLYSHYHSAIYSVPLHTQFTHLLLTVIKWSGKPMSRVATPEIRVLWPECNSVTCQVSSASRHWCFSKTTLPEHHIGAVAALHACHHAWYLRDGVNHIQSHFNTAMGMICFGLGQSWYTVVTVP